MEEALFVTDRSTIEDGKSISLADISTGDGGKPGLGNGAEQPAGRSESSDPDSQEKAAATATAEQPHPAGVKTGQAGPAASEPPVSTPATPETVATPTPPRSPEKIKPGSGRLSMRFTKDSWLEVYDNDEKKLFFSLAKAGERVSLEGRPPLRILIGYAPGVRIEYNGEFFDQAPFMKKGVARFSVGEAANGED